MKRKILSACYLDKNINKKYSMIEYLKEGFNMGKKGKVNLIIPKNDFNKKDFELVLQILKNHGGQYETSKLEDEINDFYVEHERRSLDRTSVIHRLVAPRYLGFTYQENNNCYLSEFGDYYINSHNLHDRIDCIFLAMSSITFGKNNPGTSSDSRVEAPNVFLKMLADLGTATLKEFMVILYLMDVKELSYSAAIEKIRKNSNLTNLAVEAETAGCRKFKDPKINIFFEEVGLVEKEGFEYQLSEYVRNTYYYYLKDLSAVNEDIEEDKSIYESPSEPTINDILEELAKNQRKYEGDYFEPSLTQTGKMKIKRVARKIGFKTRNKILNEAQCNKLGWLGEQYIKDLLSNPDSDIRNHIKLEKNESISEIVWFNEGCSFDSNWEDQSVGHGYDMELITNNNRKIMIEVKSSLSNTPFFSTTNNELLTMAENKNNYYLIKVENIKALYENKKPSIAIVKNPIRLLENLRYIKDISFYL